MTWNPNATVTIDGVDFTGNTLNGVSVSYGRPTIWDQARASYATISILNTNNTNYGFEINDPVTIEVQNSSAADITVFTGVITEISNEVAVSGSSATVAVQTITAVGPFAQMSRTIIGNTNWPKEYDDDRLNRIFTDAGVTIDTVDTPGVYEFTARDKNAEDAYSLAASYASQAFGYIYETKTGSVGYANESRRTVDVNNNGYLDIDEGYINWRGINSRKSISDILNRVILFYKENDEVTSEDTHSITQYGLYEGRIDTELENMDEAQNVADRFVSLRSIPETNFSSFNINLDNPNVTAGDLDDLLNINMGTAFQIDNLPNPISPITYKGFVEGWSLVIDRSQALLTIISSDSAYSVVPIRWQDVDPLTEWDDVDPSATRTTKTNLIQNPSFEPVDYGKLGYIYVPGISGYEISTPDSAVLDITGDLDIRVKVAMNDWTPSGISPLIGNAFPNGGYALFINTSGYPILYWYEGVNLRTATGTLAPGYSDGNAGWIRAVLDVNDGGIWTVRFYKSDNGTNWTEFTSNSGTTTTSISASSASLRLGTLAGFTSVTAPMKIYAASIRNGINGTEVFQFDVAGNWKPSDIDSFTAQTGQTVALSPSMAGYGWGFPGSVGTNYNFSRSTAQVSSGLTSGLYTAVTTGAGSIVTRSLANLNTRIPVASGDTIYFAFKARRNVGNRNARARILTYNSTTSSTVVEQIVGSTITLSSTVWTVCQVSGTLTNPNSLFMDAYIDIIAGSVNESLYVDAIIVEKNSGGYAAYYFDGSYSDIPADRDGILAWSGTTNFSTSTANAYWGTKPATTWDNVDIQGLP